MCLIKHNNRILRHFFADNFCNLRTRTPGLIYLQDRGDLRRGGGGVWWLRTPPGSVESMISWICPCFHSFLWPISFWCKKKLIRIMKILNFCRFLLPKLRNLVFANSVRLNNIASQIHKVSSCKDTGRIIKQYNNKTIFLFFLAIFFGSNIFFFDILPLGSGSQRTLIFSKLKLNFFWRCYDKTLKNCNLWWFLWI